MRQDPGLDELGLARLERVDPRAVWKNEAYDLTPWLQKNVDVLASALGITIIPTQREVRVGAFRLDILGEDDRGRPIIIENQLEATDHNHLGQLIVYASGLEAAIVVWTTPSFRAEHRRALDWLNERTDENVHFFGVELDLVRIGDSAPAPQFRLVAQPNDWQKAVKDAGISETRRLRHDFFVSVTETIAARRPGFRPPSVGYDNWISMRSGPFGYYAVSFAAGDRLRCEVYLDLGDREKTKVLFDSLFADSEPIELAFGHAMSWERLDDRRASRIAVYRPAPQLDGESAEEREWAADAITSLMDVLDDLLRRQAGDLRRT